jgi:hypothetical protein
MVDYIANYLQNIRQIRVFPNVSPGYMCTLVPETTPQDGESWEDIFRDVERVIMPGVSILFIILPYKSHPQFQFNIFM